MRRFLLGFLVALALAVPVTLIAAPPKSVNVVTPMKQDLDGGNFDVTNVGNYFTTAGAIMGGDGFQGHGIVLTNGSSSVIVGYLIGGTTDPTIEPPDGVTMPGALYVRRVDPTHGQLWFNACEGSCWTKLAGSP